jgi:hypothetical protein
VILQIEPAYDPLGKPAAPKNAVLRVVVLIRFLPEHRIVGIQIADCGRPLILNQHLRRRPVQGYRRVGLQHQPCHHDGEGGGRKPAMPKQRGEKIEWMSGGGDSGSDSDW